MKTGLIWFRVAVIGFALFQVAMVLFSTLPLMQMGAAGAVFPAIIATLIGSQQVALWYCIQQSCFTELMRL